MSNIRGFLRTVFRQGGGSLFRPAGVDGDGKKCYAESVMKNARLKGLIGDAKTVVMLGMCKNAGKTTALCRLIRELAEEGGAPAALTSIGRDGESRDLVTGTDKPPIYMYEGMLAATAKELLPLSDVSREILTGTGLYTSLGEVMIFRARSDGFVQLAGPAIVGHLEPLKEMLRGLGAGRLLIDGALSRRSPAAAAKDGAVILSTGASLDRSMERTITETAYAARILCLPQEAAPGEEKGHFTLFGEDKNGRPAEDLNALQRGMGEETLLINGALTESQAAGLLRSPVRKEGLTLLARDAGCLMLQRETFEGLSRRGVKFAVKNAVRLAAVTVNPVSAGGWHFPEDEFRERMQEAVGVPVLNVMTGEESHDPADI